MMEVGQLKEPRSSGTYPPGQLFLHKSYGYRGVVLFPWSARVFDRDNHHDLNTENCTFYSALIDERDSPLIRAGKESVTVVGDLDYSRSQYEVPGLDYVDHGDVLPYKDTALDKDLPLHHSSLDNFLTLQPHNDPPYKPTTTLKIWEKKSRSWMNMTEVHRETTDLIRVTVIPFYLGRRLAVAQQTGVPSSHVWRYHISLENLGPLAIQVIDSMWYMCTECGGVVSERSAWLCGQEPVLFRRQPAFQYCGHASLPTTRGYMFGYFRLSLDDGHKFFCRSPILELKVCPPANNRHEDE